MSKRQSGLITWSYIARGKRARDSIESYLPLILSAAGALCIFPFVVIRFMEGQPVRALIDIGLIAGILTLGVAVYYTRRVRYASIAVALLCLGGVLNTVYLNGPQQVYWSYPALLAIFYLLRPIEAILLTLTLIAALIPAFLPIQDPVETTTVFMSIILMSAFGYAASLVNNRQHEQLMRLATKDPLTGAGNRRALEAKLEQVVRKSRRQPTVASLIMLDIDHFKAVNDAHGHATGDQILQSLTEIINLRIRVTDSLFRIGGEEFVIVLDGQGREQAQHLAEQLRTLVEANELVPTHDVTISLGVAELMQDQAWGDWLHRADQAMYDAKRRGRNITRLAG
jgi:diguanylate cyclase (GGDEF)-like protein